MGPSSDDYLTRRRFLGGVGLGSLGVAGLLTPSRWLPNSVVGLRMQLVSTPDVQWYPPVTNGHFESSRRELMSKVERAEGAWKGLEAPEEDSFYLTRGSLDEAKEYLHDAKGASATRDNLFSLMRGAASAGRAVGAARVIREETDPEALVEQGRSIHEKILETANGIDYRVGDPSIGLAHLYASERYLGLAALNSYVEGTYLGGRRSADDIEEREYETHTIVTTWSSHFEARQYHHDGAQYYQSYAASRPSETTSVESRLQRVRSSFDTEIAEDRQSFDRRDEIADSLPEGAYRRVRFRLWQFTHGDMRDYRNEGWLRNLLARQTVTAARNVLKLRAYRTALDELTIKQGDSVEMPLVLKAKRRAADAARIALDGTGPFTRVLLKEVADLFMDAKVGFDSSNQRDQAEAYADYLLVLGYCRHVDAVRKKFL
jgi:hypothetical protein